MNITFYSKPHCPLCDKAKAALDLVCETLNLTYQEVDIYSDDVLLEKYQLMIPVVEVDSDIVAAGQVTYSKLKKSLEERL